MNQSELEANTCHRRQARENACEQVAIGLSFTSDWWRKWREYFQPITERSKAKPKQNANYFRHSNENRSIMTDMISAYASKMGVARRMPLNRFN